MYPTVAIKRTNAVFNRIKNAALNLSHHNGAFLMINFHKKKTNLQIFLSVGHLWKSRSHAKKNIITSEWVSNDAINTHHKQRTNAKKKVTDAENWDIRGLTASVTLCDIYASLLWEVQSIKPIQSNYLFVSLEVRLNLMTDRKKRGKFEEWIHLSRLISELLFRILK